MLELIDRNTMNRKRKRFIISLYIVMFAALVLIIGVWNRVSALGEAYWQALLFAGWPKAWVVFNLAKEVWAEGACECIGKDAQGKEVSESGKEQSSAYHEAKAKHQASMIFPIGEPNTGFAKYFIGQSYLAPVSRTLVGIYNVTFEPGCRNNWHTHHAKEGGGQILICVAGRGYYQEWGKDAIEMKPGDCIQIPAGVKHWHGATPDSWFSHLAVEVPGTDCSNEWLEPVDDAQYGISVKKAD